MIWSLPIPNVLLNPFVLGRCAAAATLRAFCFLNTPSPSHLQIFPPANPSAWNPQPAKLQVAWAPCSPSLSSNAIPLERLPYFIYLE